MLYCEAICIAPFSRNISSAATNIIVNVLNLASQATMMAVKPLPPAVLVEIGFLTNPSDEAALISGAYRDQVAAGVARGILSYLTTARKPAESEKRESREP